MAKSDSVHFEQGVAITTAPGESQPGDSFLFLRKETGFIAMVVDGLGHGSEAAEAAQLAVETVESNALENPIALMERCHEMLLNTRGAAMAIAEFVQEGSMLRTVVVGNVLAMLVHKNEQASPREQVMQRSGTVGLHLPPLSLSMSVMSPHDTFVMVTDGVKTDFDDELALHLAPQRLAEDIVSNHRLERDDALALVVRRGGPA